MRFLTGGGGGGGGTQHRLIFYQVFPFTHSLILHYLMVFLVTPELTSQAHSHASFTFDAPKHHPHLKQEPSSVRANFIKKMMSNTITSEGNWKGEVGVKQQQLLDNPTNYAVSCHLCE